MKVDNSIIDGEKIARGIYVASLATFIFTSMFAISLANSGALSESATASVINSNYHSSLANVAAIADDNNGGAGGSANPTTTSNTTGGTTNDGQVDVPKASVAILSVPAKAGISGVTKISWKSENVSTCVVKKDGADFSTMTSSSGISSGLLSKDTKFTIECVGASGTVSSSAVVTAIAPVVATVAITASNTDLSYDGETYIAWKSENAKSCTIKKDGAVFATKPASPVSQNMKTGKLIKNTKFTIDCVGTTNVATASVDIVVKQLIKPTVKITVSRSEINSGESVDISWTSTDATKCTVMNGARSLGNKVFSTLSGQVVKESTVIWAVCSNQIGTVADSVSIQVVAPVAGGSVAPAVTTATSGGSANSGSKRAE